MGLISKDAILGARDANAERIAVPEWGGDVLIAVMSGAARDAFRAAIGDGQGGQTADVGLFEASLLAATLVQEDGAPMFSADEVEALRAKAAPVLDRLAAEALRINGMTASSREDAAKNSERGRKDGSGSGSRSPSE